MPEPIPFRWGVGERAEGLVFKPDGANHRDVILVRLTDCRQDQAQDLAARLGAAGFVAIVRTNEWPTVSSGPSANADDLSDVIKLNVALKSSTISLITDRLLPYANFRVMYPRSAGGLVLVVSEADRELKDPDLVQWLKRLCKRRPVTAICREVAQGERMAALGASSVVVGADAWFREPAGWQAVVTGLATWRPVVSI